MQCTVCESTQVVRAFEHNGFQLLRCQKCSHLFVDNVTPVGADYDAAYYGANLPAGDKTTGYFDYLGSLDRRIKGFRDRVDQIEAFTGRRGRLLDYGCAVGACVRAAKDSGWDAVGFERSTWAAEQGRELLGVEIFAGDTPDEALFPRESFDVVTLWDVIEHVDKPREVLEFASRVLRPGGLLAMNTVNASSAGARIAGKRWRHLSPPHHLQYFTRASLRQLVEGAGFEIARSEANGVMIQSASRSGPVPRPLRLIEEILTHWRMRPIARALNLLDEIEIMAVLKRS